MTWSVQGKFKYIELNLADSVTDTLHTILTDFVILVCVMGGVCLLYQ